MQPVQTEPELRRLFHNLQTNGTLTLEDFLPPYQSWLKKNLEITDTDVLKPSPLSAFYSHPTNKSYEVRVGVNDVRYIKISYSNPDNYLKTLSVQSENSDLITVRKGDLLLEPRTGLDHMRLKVIGRPRPCRNVTRLAISRNDTGEVVEILLFHVVTSDQAPRPPADLLSPES